MYLLSPQSTLCKQALIILVAILARATVAAGFECPPGEDGYFPDPEDCAGFYECTAGFPPFWFKCEDGLLFNPDLGVCDWWYNVDCDVTTTSTASGQPSTTITSTTSRPKSTTTPSSTSTRQTTTTTATTTMNTTTSPTTSANSTTTTLVATSTRSTTPATTLRPTTTVTATTTAPTPSTSTTSTTSRPTTTTTSTTTKPTTMQATTSSTSTTTTFLSTTSRTTTTTTRQMSTTTVKECPVEWTKTETSCYKLEPTLLTWNEAETRCNGLEAHLASVQSEDEAVTVYSVSKGKFVWLGGSRHTHTGFWSWTDGSTWSFTQWAHGHPHKDNNVIEFGISVSHQFVWYSTTPDNLKASICEINL